MNNGTVGLVTGYRVEADIAKKRLFHTQRRQLRGDTYLRFLPCRNGCLQPSQKLYHGNAVTYHRTAEAFYLNFVLDGLHSGNRRRRTNHLLHTHLPEERVGSFVRVKQNVILIIAAEGLPDGIVRGRLHALSREISLDGGRKFIVVDEQRDRFRTD